MHGLKHEKVEFEYFTINKSVKEWACLPRDKHKVSLQKCEFLKNNFICLFEMKKKCWSAMTRDVFCRHQQFPLKNKLLSWSNSVDYLYKKRRKKATAAGVARIQRKVKLGGKLAQKTRSGGNNQRWNEALRPEFLFDCRHQSDFYVGDEILTFLCCTLVFREFKGHYLGLDVW